jgi:hypothetical protein
MSYSIELEMETDGRWIAEVINLPGVLAYGNTKEEAKENVKALALRVRSKSPPSYIPLPTSMGESTTADRYVRNAVGVVFALREIPPGGSIDELTCSMNDWKGT